MIVAKPTVYVPNELLAACRALYHPRSVSELVRAGLVHVLARGPEVAPADELRALIAVEQLARHPNRAWLAAAEHALHTRQAKRFLSLEPPRRGVSS